jgi:hypothetical protein
MQASGDAMVPPSLGAKLDDYADLGSTLRKWTFSLRAYGYLDDSPNSENAGLVWIYHARTTSQVLSIYGLQNEEFYYVRCQCLCVCFVFMAVASAPGDDPKGFQDAWQIAQKVSSWMERRNATVFLPGMRCYNFAGVF